MCACPFYVEDDSDHNLNDKRDPPGRGSQAPTVSESKLLRSGATHAYRDTVQRMQRMISLRQDCEHERRELGDLPTSTTESFNCLICNIEVY